MQDINQREVINKISTINDILDEMDRKIIGISENQAEEYPLRYKEPLLRELIRSSYAD